MSSSEYKRKKAILAEIESKNSEYEKKSKQSPKVKEIATLDSVKKKKETKKKSTYKPMSMVYKELRESRKEKPNEGAFDDNYEQELIKSLFKDDNKKSKDTSEVQEPEQVVEEKPKKRTGEWDYTLDDEIKFFDPECSYELTGYKPITETKGLDFNPDWFTETSRIYDETGQYTEYPKGSKPYADFWDEQFERCKEGYEVNGYRITGDNYFFLNFYRMQTIVEGRIAGKGRNEKFPSFFAKQYEFFHYVEMAEKLHKDVTILKARGLGLSEQVASMLVRPYTTNRGYKSLLTAPDAPKLKSTKDKCWKQLNWLDMYTNGGMRHVRQKVNNDDCKRASKVNKEGTEFGWMSEINTVIADSADKIRGDRLDRLIYEEAGSNRILTESWIKSNALVELGGEHFGTRISLGTGWTTATYVSNNVWKIE